MAQAEERRRHRRHDPAVRARVAEALAARAGATVGSVAGRGSLDLPPGRIRLSTRGGREEGSSDVWPVFWKVAVACVLALAFLAPSAQAAFPGENGKIVFSRPSAACNPSLYTVNPDGTGQARITTDPAGDGYDPDVVLEYGMRLSSRPHRNASLAIRGRHLCDERGRHRLHPAHQRTTAVPTPARPGRRGRATEWPGCGTW